MDILFVTYTGYSEDIRRISIGLVRVLIRCISVWVKVVDELDVDFFRYLFFNPKLFVINNWNNVEIRNYNKSEKNKFGTNPKKKLF